ncbi:MAG: hypothetical protein ACLR5M_09505 [Bifidobacterium longum]
MMITRTITKYEVTAYKLYVDHGVPKLDKIGSAEVEGTRCDKTMARKAIADATGKTLPKGVEVEVVPKTVTTYGMDLDKFLSQAQVVCVKEGSRRTGSRRVDRLGDCPRRGFTANSEPSHVGNQ